MHQGHEESVVEEQENIPDESQNDQVEAEVSSCREKVPAADETEAADTVVAETQEEEDHEVCAEVSSIITKLFDDELTPLYTIVSTWYADAFLPPSKLESAMKTKHGISVHWHEDLVHHCIIPNKEVILQYFPNWPQTFKADSQRSICEVEYIMKTARHWRAQVEKTFGQLSPALEALYDEVSTFQTFEDLRTFVEAYGQELESDYPYEAKKHFLCKSKKSKE